jgi:hypothetical protein
MTLHFTTRLARLLVIAAALTAIAAPAALAQPDTWYANAVSNAQSSSGTTFITDTLGTSGYPTRVGTSFITDPLVSGRGTTTDVCMHAMPVSVAQAQACAAPAEPTSAPVQPVGDGGFNWGILGLAVGGALALLLGLYGGVRIRSHHRPATV